MIPNSILLGVALFIGVVIGASCIVAILEVTNEIAKKGLVDKESDEWINWEKYVTTQGVIKWGIKGASVIALITLIVYVVAPMDAIKTKEVDWGILASTFTILFLGAPFTRGILDAYNEALSQEKNKLRSNKK